MTDLEAGNIIETVMKVHWPKWEFRGQELKVWIEELRKFDYETAKYAINELYKVWESTRYPKLPIIMGNIRKLSRAKRQSGYRLARLYTILRQDGRPRWFPFNGNANTPRGEIEQAAEKMRTEANRLYPGDNHIIQYHSTDEPKESDEQESQEKIPF